MHALQSPPSINSLHEVPCAVVCVYVPCVRCVLYVITVLCDVHLWQ